MTLPIRKLARLTPRARAYALRAAWWLIAARCAVRLLSYGSLRRLLARLPARRAVRHPMTPAECARAVGAATRVLPGATCLARAVAAACLLQRDGQPCTVALGVRLDADSVFHAHAWAECDGEVVTGKEAIDGHRVLLRDLISSRI